MKKELIITSLISILLMMFIFYSEILSPEYQQYQNGYMDTLRQFAAQEGDVSTNTRFPVRILQLVLPELNRVDRCTSCHISIEDPRMKDAPQPLTAHSGDYLQTHDI